MTKGLQRFEYYLQQAEELFAKAEKQKNPALFLYKNNCRTIFFMLQALAKLYGTLHNSKKFTKLKEQFKTIEDSLGGIDYYDAMTQSFATNKKVPVEIARYFKKQTNNKVAELNNLLVEKKWIKYNKKRINKIREKLSEAEWMEEQDEVLAIKNFYVKSIEGIIEFVREKKFVFTDVEHDVHELRRKIRWLSIYPQALRGVVQLSQSKTITASIKKYLTKEIVNSPYNKLPAPDNSNHLLLLDKNSFFALSWMINELGIIKDKGLKILALEEAIKNLKLKTSPSKILNSSHPTLPNLLKEASGICKKYFEDGQLEKLVLK